MQAVAASSSFTKAAATEHISPSVLSRRVKDVERLLRVRLFERTTRRVVPTAAGRAFLVTIGSALDDMEVRLHRFMSYAATETGVLRVAALPSFATVLLPGIVRAFTEDRPDVTIETIECTAERILERLEGGGAELGLTTSVSLPHGYYFRPLLEERFHGVAVPLDAPDATRTVGIAYRHPESLSLLAAHFLEFLRIEVAADGSATAIDNARARLPASRAARAGGAG